MSTDDGDEGEIQNKLRDVIGSEFEGLGRGELSDALKDLADEYESGEPAADGGNGEGEHAGETSQGRPAWTRTSSGTLKQVSESEEEYLDAFSSTIIPFDVDREGHVPLITVSPRDDDALSRVFGQLLDVQALWLEIDDPPPLNEAVEILVEMPEYGFENAMTGRVVHQSGSRAAVDLSEVEDGELDSIREVHERHRARVEAEESSDQADESLGIEPTARGTSEADVSDSWDGSASSSLALSRTFETVTEQESYWYGPKSPWLEAREVGPSAELFEDVGAEELLLEVSERAFTGLVEFGAGERRFQLLVEEGYIVAVTGRPHEAREELGPMLRVAERVTEDALAEASSYAIKKELSLEMALARLGVLSPDEVRQAVGGRLTYLLRKICDVDEGAARLTTRANLSRFPIPSEEVRAHVPVESVIFRRRIDRFHRLASEERDQRVETYGDRYPDIDADAEGRIERAFADEAHRSFVVRFVDGTTSLRDLIAESFLPPAEAVSVLDALRSMSLVRFRDAPVGHDVVERFSDDIHVKHLSVHKASYFEVLNVHWSSYDAVVEAAYREQRDYFDPDRAPEELSRERHRQLEEIAERIDSAYRVLEERKSRHGYREKIMPEYKLEHGLPLLLRRGRMAKRKGERETARDAFARVLEIDPERSDAARELRELKAESAAQTA